MCLFKNQSSKLLHTRDRFKAKEHRLQVKGWKCGELNPWIIFVSSQNTVMLQQNNF